VQREKARDLRARAANIMAQLGQEKNTLYAKKTSIASMAMYLEQLERQLRTTMPQHVIDMLGQGSVATR
jgi:conjugative transfer pilus assembly protein TraH